MTELEIHSVPAPSAEQCRAKCSADASGCSLWMSESVRVENRTSVRKRGSGGGRGGEGVGRGGSEGKPVVGKLR